MIPLDLLSALQAGGNIAMIAVAVGFWKLDRRVYKIELQLVDKPVRVRRARK